MEQGRGKGTRGRGDTISHSVAGVPLVVGSDATRRETRRRNFDERPRDNASRKGTREFDCQPLALSEVEVSTVN